MDALPSTLYEVIYMEVAFLLLYLAYGIYTIPREYYIGVMENDEIEDAGSS